MPNCRSVKTLIVAALLCGATASSYAQDWFWKNPLPQGNDVNALCSAGSGVIFGVGSYGTVVKSTNGGKNWSLVETPTTINFHGVSFVSPDRGMIVGDGGVVLQTTDGGTTWDQKTIFSGATLYDVSFSDPLNGTVVGYPGIVLRTSDGGSTWRQQLAGGGDRLYDVEFIDSNRGMIVGSQGVIFRTTNAGKSWGRQVDSTIRDLYRVSLPDTSNGYAVGTDGTILHTSDGGRNWKLQQSGVFSGLKGVSFADVNNGCVVGDAGIILMTTDGGTTWVLKPPGPFSSLTTVLQNDAMNAVVIGLSGVAFRTTDGGSSWDQTSVGPVVPFRGVSVTDATHGIAVGYLGTIMTSSDGGNHWVNRDIGITDNLDAVASWNSDTAIAVGENGIIIRTEDGGLTWTDISLPPTDTTPPVDTVDTYWHSGVAFSPRGNVLVVGKLSRSVGTVQIAHQNRTPVLRSTDFGTTWSSMVISYKPVDPQAPRIYLQDHLLSVAFVDSNTAVAVGENGRTLRTTNGGAKWDTISVPTVVNLNSVAFSKSRIGIGTAVGEGPATALWTTNGGLSWEKVLLLGQPLRAVSYGDSTFAVTAGDGGRIFFTYTGGRTWTPLSLEGTSKIMVLRTDKDLFGVSTPGGGRISVVGDGGVILGSFGPDIPVRVLPPDEPAVPRSMVLYPNYPNPFNPTTTISYQIPANAGTPLSDVRLSIFNILGQEIAVLVNERKSAGFYQVVWDASNLPSGVYVCRLSAEGTMFAQKLLLIK